MSPSNRWLVWAPRVLAAGFAIFLSLFAGDASNEAESDRVRSMGFFMHLLPALFCALVAVLAWKKEWIGALVFGLLAGIYAWWAWAHPQWIFVIATPMLLLSVLYVLAWRERRKTASTPAQA